MKLNESAQINSISDEYIMLMDANGNPLKIAKADLANALASFVPATKGEVWIVYLDSDKSKILIPWEQWPTSRTDAVGVAIMSGGKRLLIAPHESSLPWSSDVGSGGAVTATVKATADGDYAGQSNTNNVVTSAAFAGDGDSYAPGYCAAYNNGGVTAGSWWLPSLGELGLIYEKFDAINAALDKINGAIKLTRGPYHSSTEYSEKYAWVLFYQSGFRASSIKTTSKYGVRPVTSF